MSELLDQLRAKIRLKHYSIRTEEAYVRWCKRFILFHHKRHPAEMGAPEVEQYLTHLVVTEAEPLIAYILSSVTWRVAEGRLPEMRAYVEGEIAQHGAIRITKESGLFAAIL